MKPISILGAGAIAAMLAGASTQALAKAAHTAAFAGWESAEADNPPSFTTVGPLSGTVTAYNYDPDGTTVNGLYIDASDTLLTFPGPVCGGVGSLATVGDVVTYSGTEASYSSGFHTVTVTSYTDGSISYAKPASRTGAALAPYPLTAGALTALNFDPDDGSINGFFFTPASGAAVFVDIGHASSTVAGLLAAGAPLSLSVDGALLPTPACTKTARIGVVVATSLTIGDTAYAVGGYGYGAAGLASQGRSHR